MDDDATVSHAIVVTLEIIGANSSPRQQQLIALASQSSEAARLRARAAEALKAMGFSPIKART